MNKLKKFLPILLVLCVLTFVYSAKMYVQDDPALNSEIENIYLEMQRGIRVKIGSFTCPAGTGNYSVTGVGFKPRYVEFQILVNSATSAVGSQGRMDYNGNQHSHCWRTATGAFSSLYATDYCITMQYTAVNDVIASYISMDSDGFTVNFAYVNVAYKIGWKAVR